MCPSRLPSEETSYRPSGMLDRDQRTAPTIKRIRRVSSNIPTNYATKLAPCTSAMEFNHSRLNPSAQCHSIAGVKCQQMDPPTIKSKDLPAGYSLRCKCDTLWEDNSVSNIRPTRKYVTAGGRYQSRKKIVNCLFVLIIWIATVHRTCAYPLTQADMSGEISQYPDEQRCQQIRDALIKPIAQASIGFNYIRGMVDNFTQALLRKDVTNAHEEWKKHQAHFHYPVEITQHLPDNFDDEPPKIQPDRLFTESELETEFRRIYLCLHTVNSVFSGILENHRVNETQILHHLNNSRETHATIKNMFMEQLRYSNLDITEIKAAMTALHIPYPETTELKLMNSNNRVIGEWIATREYLKLLQYMKGAYTTLLDRCSLKVT